MSLEPIERAIILDETKRIANKRHLLNLSTVTLAETNGKASVLVLMGLAAANGGTYSTTVSKEDCEEFYNQAQKWAEFSQGGYYVGELANNAPQLVVCDEDGMVLIPTAVYQVAKYLQQFFVSGTLRLKNGDAYQTMTANCTVIFNTNKSCDFLVSVSEPAGATTEGVCLPVVELTTEPIVGTSAALTADESAKLDEVVTLKTPIVLNFVYPDMGEMSCVCFYMASANGFVHHFSFGNAMTLIVGYGDGAWYTSLTEG